MQVWGPSRRQPERKLDTGIPSYVSWVGPELQAVIAVPGVAAHFAAVAATMARRKSLRMLPREPSGRRGSVVMAVAAEHSVDGVARGALCGPARLSRDHSPGQATISLSPSDSFRGPESLYRQGSIWAVGYKVGPDGIGKQLCHYRRTAGRGMNPVRVVERAVGRIDHLVDGHMGNASNRFEPFSQRSQMRNTATEFVATHRWIGVSQKEHGCTICNDVSQKLTQLASTVPRQKFFDLGRTPGFTAACFAQVIAAAGHHENIGAIAAKLGPDIESMETLLDTRSDLRA